MSEHSVNNQNNEPKEEQILTGDQFDIPSLDEPDEIDKEFSSVFGNPAEHRKKAPAKPWKKYVTAITAAVLAVAILIGGTVYVVKKIPKKEPEITIPNDYYDSGISVLSLDTADFSKLTVVNANGTFVFIPKHGESGTTWTVEGMDPALTSSSTISSKASNFASMQAVREITGRTAEQCGLANPATVVTAEVKNEDDTVTSYTLKVGAKSTDSNNVYVQLDGDEKIYLVSASDVDYYEFELLDLASTTGFSGFTVTEDIASYAQEGSTTITSFDKLTISGKNYPQPIVMVPNNQNEQISQFFTYLITTPNERYADNLNDTFTLFSTGLTVSGAYSFDVSQESINKVGLNDPDLVITMNVGSHYKTYKFKKVDDSYCAVINNDSKMISKVSLSNIPYFDYTPEDYYNKSIYLRHINDIDTFTVEMNGEKHVFGVNFDAKAEEDDMYKVTYGGKEITAQYFQDFYQQFISLQFSDFSTDGDISSPDMKITIVFKESGITETVEYKKVNATRYMCTINGKPLGRIVSTDYNALIKSLGSVTQNKPVK